MNMIDNEIKVLIGSNNTVLKFPKCNMEVPAFIGKNGPTTNKREGDDCTPVGKYDLGLLLGTHNKIYNEDCFITMSNMDDNFVDIVMTSPPYNMTARKGGYADSGRYDVYEDWMTETEYIEFTIKLFNNFNRIVKPNGVVLYNFSYSIENPSLPYKLVAEIVDKTEWCVADTIMWKKGSGLPFPANERRLSRNWEFVWVFVRKDEIDTLKKLRDKYKFRIQATKDKPTHRNRNIKRVIDLYDITEKLKSEGRKVNIEADYYTYEYWGITEDVVNDVKKHPEKYTSDNKRIINKPIPQPKTTITRSFVVLLTVVRIFSMPSGE